MMVDAPPEVGFKVDGLPITRELRMLLEPFGRGVPITGILIVPGDEHFVVTFGTPESIQFQVRFNAEYPSEII